MQKKLSGLICIAAIFTAVVLLFRTTEVSYCSEPTYYRYEFDEDRSEQIEEVMDYSRHGFQMKIANMYLIGTDPRSIDRLLNQYDYIIDKGSRTVFFIEKEEIYNEFR